MGKIRILPDDVASQVAAGEVVERPASLVKELVENSLDAGSTRIVVDFSKGGAYFVGVSDDGCGMDREDALMALERHATSKIRSGGDLSTVRTMGFRGEALPSIASVSRFRMVTRERGSDIGVEVTVNGGRLENVKEIGASPGTQIEVRDLFYNIPARRKFLRGEETEAAHIVHGMEAIALANPSVAFECRRDGRAVGSWPHARELAVRIRDVLGKEHLDRLAPVPPMEGDGFRISGFLARAGQGRRDRLHQYVILNGRPIVCAAVQQPLREAYSDALARGEHPLSVLFIEMDPDLVDCNVHPAKREVRLRRPDILRRAVYDAARAVITTGRPVASVVPVTPQPAFAPETPQSTMSWKSSETASITRDPEIPVPKEEPQPEIEPVPYRILGRVGDGYLVMEGDEGLVLLDQRAAGERVLFENLVRGMESGHAPCQHLLIPTLSELPAREFAWAVEHLEDLRQAGFSIEPFGTATLRIDGMPSGMEDGDPATILHEVISVIRATGKVSHGKGIREALARSVARIAAHSTALPRAEAAERLLRELLRCQLPYASPDGRPTMIQFSFGELARKFGRS